MRAIKLFEAAASQIHISAKQRRSRFLQHSAQKREFHLPAVRPILQPARNGRSFNGGKHRMAKRTFAVAASLALLLATNAQTTRAEDGCDVLKEKVRTNVYASATEFAADKLARGIGSTGQTGAVGSTLSGSQTCISTAQATTRGFSEALAALNMPLIWTSGPMNPGDYCISRDLRECYPSQHPLNPSLPPSHVAFLDDAWAGVRKGIALQMPFGTATGVSQFTLESLDATLSSSLKSSVGGPLYSSYQVSQGARTER